MRGKNQSLEFETGSYLSVPAYRHTDNDSAGIPAIVLRTKVCIFMRISPKLASVPVCLHRTLPVYRRNIGFLSDIRYIERK